MTNLNQQLDDRDDNSVLSNPFIAVANKTSPKKINRNSKADHFGDQLFTRRVDPHHSLQFDTRDVKGKTFQVNNKKDEMYEHELMNMLKKMKLSPEAKRKLAQVD